MKFGKLEIDLTGKGLGSSIITVPMKTRYRKCEYAV